ncbi:universal stress protein [Desulfoferrobacter suflitae]|uniref:universal stress protein n=1 Tax=Desulfoferrobacter suflitae TaxID=2865782 RepID=UPI0021647C51|nr:universal stress protein [Desulfoferrobacter suflitae]MCK8601583.1 universal stress protein [Desulfoferrobacter suflitae]
MQDTMRILIAVDGSNHSLNAVRYVGRYCSHGVFVNFIHILPKKPEQVFWQVNLDEAFIATMKARYQRWEQEQRRAGRAVLESARHHLVRCGFRENRLHTMLCERQTGTAADIVAEAQNDYQALVIGRRGLNKMDSLFLGSVSNRIVELLKDTPVWLIGGDVRSMRILVAVDGSHNSAKAVEYLAGCALSGTAEIALCHVVRGLDSFGAPVFELDQDMATRLEASLRAGLTKMFDDYRERLVKAGISAQRISTKYLPHSFSRAGDLLRAARQGGYGTIVMGRRGISKVRQFLLGRVTVKVLNGADDLAVWIVP